ncbi:MAG TPA: amidohydrolase family protein [Candidatus Hydrogenedentes bacterium]|nr:amidohydrolase family protein [Candidatus Hydrogenedentota bacterium]HPG70084.1 amidohydrolase family protein [Candidatus Hydrogenedentota bacterium]
MFIDIHVHVRKHTPVLRHGKPAYATPAELLARYDAIGVERAVILPEASPECAYMPQSNEEALDIAHEFPDRFIPFCNIDPRAMTNSAGAPLGDLLRHYRDLGCKGIGEVSPNLPFLDPLVQNLFKHAEEANLPLTFHVACRMGGIYGLYDDPGLPQFEESLMRFPRLTFLAHSQSFWAEMAPLRTPDERGGYPKHPVHEEGAVPKLFRRYGNLHGDLSAGSGCNALTRDPEYAVRFLNEFQDRLFFGTDICAPDTPTPLVDFLLGLRNSGMISETVFQKVARENAIRLLGLE